MARKRRKADEGGGAYWMDTYGDMVTLLLTFFVLLFSFSSMDSAKWRSLVESFTGSAPPAQIESVNTDADDIIFNDKFEAEPEEETETEEPTEEELEAQAQFDELYQGFRDYLEANGLEEDIKLARGEDTITVRLGDSTLFESGQDTLLEESKPLIAALGAMLVQYETAIETVRIEGHTDNRPISNARFRNNWDLSVMRATSVLIYLLESSTIDVYKVNAGGWGEYHPVAQNEDENGQANIAGQALNRRVEIQVVRRFS